jgi:hypothetical protein
MEKFFSSKKLLLTPVLLVLLILLIPQVSFATNAAEQAILKILWEFINATFGNLMGLGGYFLDYTITHFVVGFGFYYKNQGIGFAVDLLWTTVRDIFNLTFIFGLVYIGFKTILDSSDNSAKKALGMLIMAALLVNFSLFFTKSVIDFSNIAAKQFVEEFKSKDPNKPNEYDVSTTLSDHLGVQSIFSSKDSAVNELSWSYVFGAMYLYLIAAFIFLAGAVLLAIRFIVLNIYMLLSPVMFIGWVFPSFSGVTKKYWEGFLNQAFFAPAYLVMIYFSTQIIKNLSSGVQGNLANAISGTDAAKAFDAWEGILMFFLLASGFLIASLVVAKKMGAAGATTAVSLGQKAQSKVRNYTQRAVTAPVRYPTRWATNKVGDKLQTRLNNIQARQDASGNKTTLAKVASWNWVDRSARGTTQTMKDAQFGTGTTNEKEAEYKRKTNARANQTAVANQRAANFEQQTADIADASKTTAELTTALTDLGKTIREMSKEEKNELKLEQLTNKSIAIHLTDDDIKNIEATGKYSAQEIQQIKNTRKHAFRSVATHGSTLTNTNPAGVVTGPSVANAVPIDMRSTLGNRSAKDAGNMPVEVFKEVQSYDHISPAQLEERIKNGIDPADYATIRLAIENHMGIAPGTPPNLYPAGLANNKWAKWANGHSVHAATIFS